MPKVLKSLGDDDDGEHSDTLGANFRDAITHCGCGGSRAGATLETRARIARSENGGLVNHPTGILDRNSLDYVAQRRRTPRGLDQKDSLARGLGRRRHRNDDTNWPQLNRFQLCA